MALAGHCVRLRSACEALPSLAVGPAANDVPLATTAAASHRHLDVATEAGLTEETAGLAANRVEADEILRKKPPTKCWLKNVY